MKVKSAGLAVLSAGLIASLVAVPATAGPHDGPDIHYARVVDVQPIVRQVAVEYPIDNCWTEVVYREPQRRRAPAATLAGGALGGLVGNQFGSGKGKTAATVIGGLLGAGIANSVATEPRGRGVREEVRRCETVTEVRYEERVEGYDVAYRYNGRVYHTRTLEHPGERIALRVSVTPLG